MNEKETNLLKQALNKDKLEKKATPGAFSKLLQGTLGIGATAAGFIKDSLILGPLLGAGIGGGLNWATRPTKNDRENVRRRYLADLKRRKAIQALDRAAEAQGMEDVPDEVIDNYFEEPSAIKKLLS